MVDYGESDMIEISVKMEKPDTYKGFSSSDISFFHSKNFIRRNIFLFLVFLPDKITETTKKCLLFKNSKNKEWNITTTKHFVSV